MTKTRYGYMCGFGYQDYDGSFATAEYIEPVDSGKEPDPNRCPDSLGWYADCEVEPEAGWVGPFATEAEAIKCATDENTFWNYIHRDDHMGAHMGRNE